jgi:hypothetical protein
MFDSCVKRKLLSLPYRIAHALLVFSAGGLEEPSPLKPEA